MNHVKAILPKVENEQSSSIGEDSRGFFNTKPAIECAAETYFEASTTAKKQKKISKILNDYANNLNWFSRLEGPTPALLKANQARKACKKRKLNKAETIVNYGNMVNLNNSTNHGSINVGGSPTELNPAE
ncbi:hypothetical protein MAM1_0126d06010 [Mucor ambiguus]|uniref:Uncharacterized protein n=1 Tax=Mucor ambiguus TaxID=91626 RepID=A0A0C9M882_9FUNG|nr:hypothetical protein MAM1_0126d06010 [Mucor ambiguus]